MVGFDCNDQYLSYEQLIVDNIVFQFYERIESISYLVLWFMSSVFYRVALISCIYLSTDLYIFCNLGNWLLLLVYVSNFKISSFLLTYEEVVGILKWTLSFAIISHLFQMWLFPKSRSVIPHLTCMVAEIQCFHIVLWEETNFKAMIGNQ